MSKLSIRFVALGFVIFSLIAGVFVESLVKSKAPPEAPIRSFSVAVGKNDPDWFMVQLHDQGQFIVNLKAFADANAFEMHVGLISSDGRHVVVNMQREDIKIMASNPSNPNKFYILLYKNKKSLPVDSIDTLTKSLRKLVPGIQDGS